MKYLDRLEYIASADIAVLKAKEETYQGSWKKRGGVGAFMMLARKWDRLENMCQAEDWDIFKAIDSGMLSGEDGTALAEVQDLRRYLLLVEAEIRNNVKEHTSNAKVHKDGTPKEDSNRHAAASYDSGEFVDTPNLSPGSALPKVHRN